MTAPVYGLECNLAALSEFDRFHVDTQQRICEKNLALLAQGRRPSRVLIGVAESPKEARKLAEQLAGLMPSVHG